MTVDTRALFATAWKAEVDKRLKESPAYRLEDYSVTGRAPAPYGKRNVAFWEDKGHEFVDRWVEWRKRTRWEIWETPEGNPAIELELRVTLPGDIPVLMFIDRLFVTPTGEMVVVDLKTGRTPETPEQLGVYATGIELTWGKQYRPAWGFWWDASKGEHSNPMPLDMYTPTYLGNVFQDVARGMNAGSFPAKPANNCQAWCGVSQFCAAVGGSKAAGVDPLLSAQCLHYPQLRRARNE